MSGHLNNVAVGAYVNPSLRKYIDKIVKKRKYSCRSDAIRAIILEHMAISQKGNVLKPFLTQKEDVMNSKWLPNVYKNEKAKKKENYKLILKS